jgi:phosphoribosylaminoimidazolecarboxamide formyltransferase/IMP cyclohydrolase
VQDRVPIRRALLSVSDKEGLVHLAKGLERRGVELVSTGGTAESLRRAGLKVTAVEEITGVAEMMGGRVKTLHPAIHGAVLARRGDEGDTRSLAQLGAAPIDLVCVNLYPFEDAARRPGVAGEEVIEQIDIGGPALLRSAAKNHAFVAAVSSPRQYPALLEELTANDGATTAAFRRSLAAAAFSRTAAYDAAISAWMESTVPALALRYALRRQLRYGENPHQAAALYVEPGSGAGVAAARQVLGGELSYNNLLDASAALELVADLQACGGGRIAAAIIKHGNACGAAWDRDAARACDMASAADPRAAYGGILALGAPITAALAQAIAAGSRFLEVIVAPDADEAAAAVLAERWKSLRLLACGPIAPRDTARCDVRSIPGGLLVQSPDTAVADPAGWQRAAGSEPGAAVIDDAKLAWTLAKHLKSNAVAITAGQALLGAGFGQVDRVTACRHAVERAGERLRGAAAPVAASDAFFPFPDGAGILIDAGVRCIVHPGGSKRDQETIDLCAARGVTCLLTGTRHFRH